MKVINLPSCQIAVGKVLGDYEKGDPFRIDLEQFRTHVCIVGRTGSGKSTIAKILVYELAKLGIPIFILDRTGEYAHDFDGLLNPLTVLSPGESLRLSLFELESGRDVDEQIEDWISLLNHYTLTTYGGALTPLQMRVLRECLASHYKHSKETLVLSQLVEMLRKSEESFVLHGWAESVEAVISRLSFLTSGKFRKTFDCMHGTLDLGNLLETSTIIDLSGLGDDRAKNLVSQIVSKRVYDYVRGLGCSDGVRLVYVVDEAAHLAPQLSGFQGTVGLSILDRMAVEMRKYGLSLVTVATRPTNLSGNILANAGILFACALTHFDDRKEAVKDLGVPSWRFDEYEQILCRLPVGRALVRLPGQRLDTKLVQVGLPWHKRLIERGSEHHDDDVVLVTESGEERVEVSETSVELRAWIRQILLKLRERGPQRRKSELALTRRQVEVLCEMNLVRTGEGDLVHLTEFGLNVLRGLAEKEQQQGTSQ